MMHIRTYQPSLESRAIITVSESRATIPFSPKKCGSLCREGGGGGGEESHSRYPDGYRSAHYTSSDYLINQ